MRRFLEFRLFVLMAVFGMSGRLYSSFVTTLPMLFRHVPLQVIRTWYPFLSISSLGLMSLILFVMWQVGKGIKIRVELGSTCVSLFLGA